MSGEPIEGNFAPNDRENDSYLIFAENNAVSTAPSQAAAQSVFSRRYDVHFDSERPVLDELEHLQSTQGYSTVAKEPAPLGLPPLNISPQVGSLSTKRGLSISLSPLPPTNACVQSGHALGLNDFDAAHFTNAITRPQGDDKSESLDARDSFVARELIERTTTNSAEASEYLGERLATEGTSKRPFNLNQEAEETSEQPEPPAKRHKSVPVVGIDQTRNQDARFSSPVQDWATVDINKAAHYVVTSSGVFDASMDSQEDLRRKSCKTVTGLHDLGPTSQTKSVDYITDYIPFYKSPEISVSESQYWMTGTIIACQDYEVVEKKLISGEIQAALHEFKGCENPDEQMFLLTLLRLAASCKSQGKLLIYAANAIYQIILGVLSLPDEHLSFAIKRRGICDSRGYDYFIIMSLAAHSRPVQISSGMLSFEKEVVYRNHAKLMVTAYGEALKSNPKDCEHFFPENLAAYYRTLTTHEMAVEIFIDVAKYGLFSVFTSNHMNYKWAKVFSRYLSKRKMGPNVPYLAHLVYHAPVAVSNRFESAETCYAKIFQYYLVSLSTLVDIALTSAPVEDDKRVTGHVKLAVACGKSLISMVRSAATHTSAVSESFMSLVRGRKAQRLSVLYILTVPYYPAVFDSEDQKELYETTWSFLVAISYSFPMMMSLLLDLVCDQTTPASLRGHAAMFVGTVVAITKNSVTRKQLYTIYTAIKSFASEARSAQARNLRLQLAFRLEIYLNPQKYGVKSDGSNPIRNLSPQAMFSSYKFAKEERAAEDQDSVLPKEITVDMIRLLEDGEISPLEVPSEHSLADEIVYPPAESSHSDSESESDDQDDSN